jgi:hypothetical protein
MMGELNIELVIEIIVVILSAITPIIAGFMLVIGYFIKGFHTQAMAKLDELIGSFHDMSKDLALHDQQLLQGYEEFKKIESHQKDQDEIIKKHGRDIIEIQTKIKQ